jgi:AhpD family alkylhydroperoxidase
MNTSFCKRIYTFPAFRLDVRQIFDHIDDLRLAVRGGRVNKAFAEKIMLVVSSVNACRYCCYGHSRAALAAGISDAELKSLLAVDLESSPDHEITALAFAQHYAEANGSPDPVLWQQVVICYGDDTANDIMAYLRMITFGNLLGNTFDALISRLGGKPASGSSLWNEVSVLLGAVWMPLSRLLYLVIRRDKPVQLVI